MVNEEIVKYLQEGINRGFSLDILKQKLLEERFSKEEVEDSANYLFYPHEMHVMNKKGKMMKISAIIGIILMVLVIVYSVFFLVPSLNKMLNKIPSFISAVLLVIFFVALIIFYLGFVKLGKYSMNKLLRFTSLFLVVLLIILIILSSILYTIRQSSKTEEPRSFGNDDIPFAFANSPLLSSGFGDLDNDLGEASFSFFGNSVDNVTTKISSYVILFVLLIVVIVSILFSVGLFIVRGKVKFGVIAGVFHIIVSIIALLFYLLIIYIIFINPLALLTIFLRLLFDPVLIIVVPVATVLLIALMFLFESLVLFDGNKKFE